MKYRVNEVFATVQGEASFTGTPAVFIRLQGCDVGCRFCDTKHTWALQPAKQIPRLVMLAKVDAEPSWSEVDEAELVADVRARALAARHVVITGGEPADQDLGPLSALLEREGFRVQVETSGTSPLRVSRNAFVTVSPKIGTPSGRPVLAEVMARADEIKHPTSTERHLAELEALLAHGWHRDGIPVWLQPLSLHQGATARCLEWCLERGYRLSVQTHQYIGAR